MIQHAIAAMILVFALPDTQPATVIHAFDDGLAGVRANSSAVHLNVDRDAAGAILVVEYPEPTSNPAARDVQCSASIQDWTAGRAIEFTVKPDHATRISVSFIDRNHVVYTAFQDLKGAEWQTVRIPFDEIRPNPYFQPPDANKGAPIDVSDVKFIAFAPQDKAGGRLQIGAFAVSQ